MKKSNKILDFVRSFSVLLVVIFALSHSLSLKTSALVECTPDPADPLKCFCENIQNNSDAENNLPSTSSDSTDKSICDLNKADNTANSDEGLLAKNGIVKKVLNLLSWITGLLAAVYLIIGGAKIITSGGNSDSVTSGRKMIIYAMVGIAVVISSNLIINFVIGLVNNASK